MRIIAGAWRGRKLAAPAGLATRPTAERVRQAMFDRLMHAPWAGHRLLDGAVVLDAFAGTGALGLEALSRGASHAVFIEQDRAALAALRGNIAACRAEGQCTVWDADVLRPPPGQECALVFLDPPYGRDLVAQGVAALAARGWLGPGCVVAAELGLADAAPEGAVLADFRHGAARVVIWRYEAAPHK